MRNKVKRLISAILCAVTLEATHPRPAQAQLAPAVFVLGCTVVGAVIVFSIYKRGGQGQTHTFVLQARQQRVENGHTVITWVSIATNSFRMPAESVFNAFYVWCETNKCIGMYRIQEIEWRQDWLLPPPVVSGPEATAIPHPL